MNKLNIQSIADSKLPFRYNEHVAIFTDFNEVRLHRTSDILIDGFLFAIITSGHSQLTIENEVVRLEVGDIVTCKPRHIFESGMMSMDFNALLIFASPEYMVSVAQMVRVEWTHSMLTSSYSILHADDKLLERTHLYFELIRHHIECPGSPDREASLRLLFASMFYDMHELHRLRDEEVLHQTYSSGENILQQFMQHLHRPDTPFLNVNEYAALFNITPKYFSSVCKRLTGRTANQLISDEIIRTAQISLRDSSKNIKQIADALGFKNQSHFGRFFRQHTGISPQQYRDRREM